jgi:LuxR family transcriptional regulator, maltose regulon positive regulatory protein
VSTPILATLMALLNEITTLPDDFVLVFDDYHVIEARAVDGALAFLLDHLPPRMPLMAIHCCELQSCRTIEKR